MGLPLLPTDERLATARRLDGPQALLRVGSPSAGRRDGAVQRVCRVNPRTNRLFCDFERCVIGRAIRHTPCKLPNLSDKCRSDSLQYNDDPVAVVSYVSNPPR